MPELPEVETTRRGIAAPMLGNTVSEIRVHNSQLRWPVPVGDLQKALPGRIINSVSRRGKYLLIDCGTGHLIIHLGMSGSLRILDQGTPLAKHDHVEILFTDGKVLRMHDPRRFGAVLWTADAPAMHALLVALGPEPLNDDFNGEYLFSKTRKRRCTIKSLVMDSHVVVGVGNIYASESLFRAGIRPGKSAARLTRRSCTDLASAIKQVLADAIEVGGTTLRDFTRADGQAGYFSLSLSVYGRAGESCKVCGETIKHRQIAQRSSFYCPQCQK